MTAIKLLGLLATTLALGAGCAARADLESVQLAQKDIQTRLEKLEKAQARAPAPIPTQPRQPDASKTYAVPVGKSAVRGPQDAWVTIVEISDFQCPFCSRGANTIKEIEKLYKNDVRIVFKHNPLPFHPRALPAALAAECAGAQGKFWQLADGMFAEQSKLADEDLQKLAQSHGVKAEAFNACLQSTAAKNQIGEDQALAAKFGARGTPAFFINGRFFSGAQPLAAFKAVIDEELKKAQASGISKAEYYARAIIEKGEGSL